MDKNGSFIWTLVDGHIEPALGLSGTTKGEPTVDIRLFIKPTTTAKRRLDWKLSVAPFI